jgi:hypothetical protein
MKQIAGTYHETYKLPKGTKIKFEEEKQAYTVRASNVAFAVCTKPFNARRTVLYTIIDWHAQARGPENLVLCFGAETDEQCEEMLVRLTEGQTEVSFRHRIPLRIESLKLHR